MQVPFFFWQVSPLHQWYQHMAELKWQDERYKLLDRGIAMEWFANTTFFPPIPSFCKKGMLMFSFTGQPMNWRFHFYWKIKLRACRMNRTLVVCKLFDGHCSFVHFLCLSHSDHLLSSCLAFTVRVACASMMLNVQRFHSWFTFFPVCPMWLKEIKVCKWNTLMLLVFVFFLCAVCLCVLCNSCPLLLYLFMYR